MQALRVRKDRKDNKVQRVLQVILHNALLGLLIVKHFICVQVIMEWMGYPESGVARGLVAPEVSRDLQALDRKVTEVMLRFPAVTEQQVLLYHIR